MVKRRRMSVTVIVGIFATINVIMMAESKLKIQIYPQIERKKATYFISIPKSVKE